MSKLKHLGIIMDGNRRWGKQNNVSLMHAYEAGAKNIETLIDELLSKDIKYLTLYAFSHENWNRSIAELSVIFKIAERWLEKKRDFLQSKQVKCKFIGDLGLLPHNIRNLTSQIEEETQNNDSLYLQIALSYGGQDEILRACNKALFDKVESVSKETFEKYLDTAGCPDLDLIIRTGGQKRLSNFLLWQSAYSEIYFNEKFWPDFKADDLNEILVSYDNSIRTRGV
jgi:undecaprenyl diphosphate synthase